MNHYYQFPGKALLLSGLLVLSSSALAVDLSVNNSAPLVLLEDVNLDTQGDAFALKINEPVLCHTTLSQLPLANVKAEVINPNDVGTQLPLLSNVQYGILSQLITVDINNPQSACVTAQKVNYGDVIFRDDYSSVDLRYTNLPDQIVRGQDLDYSIFFNNKYDGQVNVHLVEFASELSVHNDAFFEAPTTWECISDNGSTVVCDEDGVPNVVSNMTLTQGTTAQIDVSRRVDSRSVFGNNVQLMTAAFVTQPSGQVGVPDDIIDVFVVSHTAAVVENSAPSISWLNQPSVNFLEDETQPISLTFIIDDQTGVNVDPAYLQQAINPVNDKVSISNITAVQNQVNNYEVTFDVLPVANAFTGQGNTEQIHIIIKDDFQVNSNQLTADVDITPINDPPSFTVSCDHIVLNPTPLAGEQEVSCASQTGQLASSTWNFNDWLVNPSAGPGEEGQSLSYQFEILTDANNILAHQIIDNVSPNMLRDDLFILTNADTSGIATFELQVTDNGGLQGNGCNDTQVGDGCDTFLLNETLTIELKPPTYLISGVINGLANSGDFVVVQLNDDNGASPQPIRNLLVEGQNGGGQVSFIFDQDPLLDGYDFLLQLSDPGCVFDLGGNTSPSYSGTINGADVDDIVIDCS